MECHPDHAGTDGLHILTKGRAVLLACVAGWLILHGGSATAQDIGLDQENADELIPLIDEEFAPFPSKGSKQSCTIMISGDGKLGTNIGMDQMSSKLIGGRPGTATVTATNASFSLYYDIPQSFSVSPVGFSGSASFTGSFTGNGATNFLDLPSVNPVRLKRGITNVEVNLSVMTSNPGFTSGDYRTETTLRCE